MFQKIKEFLTMDFHFKMPVWLYWTMCFFVGSGLGYWFDVVIGKIFGMEFKYLPKSK